MPEAPGDASYPATSYILGAGFSRAVSVSMPLLAELGLRARRADPVLRERVPDHEIADFESWMSLVSTAEPYRNRAENHEALALYSRAVQQVGRIIREEVSAATTGELPVWLQRLAEVWHATRADIATFNYDTLVEVAARRGSLFDPENQLTIPWHTVINFAPAGNDRTMGEDARNVAWSSFRLLKLHGSINWFWVPGDLSGATLERVPLFDGAVDEERFFDPDRWLPGREPYIVPPVATKSAFYGESLTTHLWQSVSTSLANSDELVVLGYSIPSTDLTTHGLLRESLRDRRSLRVTVCDLNPDPVVERLRGALSPHVSVEVNTFDGPDAIRDFVDARWSVLRAEVVERMRALLTSADATPLSFNGSRHELRQVHGFTRTTNSLVLQVTRGFNPTRWGHDPQLEKSQRIGSDFFVRASEIARALEGCVELTVTDGVTSAPIWGGRPSTFGAQQWFDVYANLGADPAY